MNSWRAQAGAAVLALATAGFGVALVAQGAETATRDSPPAGGETGTAPASTSKAPKADEAGSATAVQHPQTWLEFAVAGGLLMIPIGLCSIAWLAFLLERLIATRRARALPSPFVQSVRGLITQGTPDPEQARAICKAHPSSAATVLEAALGRLDQPREDLDQAVSNVAQREIHGLRRYLRVFAVIYSVAPLLGLLGTVIGMIQAFRKVAEEGLGSGQGLAPGIYMALVTTAAGLAVAIPALITYYWFMARVDNYVHEMDILVVDYVDASRRSLRGQERLALASES